MFDWDLMISQAISYSNGQLCDCFKHFFTVALPFVEAYRKIKKIILFLYSHKQYHMLDFVIKTVLFVQVFARNKRKGVKNYVTKYK